MTVRGTTRIVAAVFIAACKGSESPAPTETTGTRGTIAIRVIVNGDPLASSRPFILRIDDEYVANAALNGIQTFVSAEGNHRVYIEPLYDLLSRPSWCVVEDPGPQIVHVGKNEIGTITFHARCPALAGNVTLTIHGAASGASAPSDVNYLIGRIHPLEHWPSTSLRVTVGGVASFNGPPGIYQIVPESVGKCDPTLRAFFTGMVPAASISAYFVARDGETTDVNSGLNCP